LLLKNTYIGLEYGADGYHTYKIKAPAAPIILSITGKNFIIGDKNSPDICDMCVGNINTGNAGVPNPNIASFNIYPMNILPIPSIISDIDMFIGASCADSKNFSELLGFDKKLFISNLNE
jgi:hypothetical protein